MLKELIAITQNKEQWYQSSGRERCPTILAANTRKAPKEQLHDGPAVFGLVSRLVFESEARARRQQRHPGLTAFEGFLHLHLPRTPF